MLFYTCVDLLRRACSVMQLYMKSSFKGKKINNVVDSYDNLFFRLGCESL